MNYKVQHNRKMDYRAKYAADAEYERLRCTPTSKQLKFFKKLCVLCKENGIEVKLERYETRTRMYMSQTIDKLIQLLNENGIDVHGNGKTAHDVISHGSYGTGYRSTERIVVEEGGNDNDK